MMLEAPPKGLSAYTLKSSQVTLFPKAASLTETAMLYELLRGWGLKENCLSPLFLSHLH